MLRQKVMKIKNGLVISDLHLGSDAIAQFRGYKDSWDFWLHYQQIHNSQIMYDNQPVFILGDIAINADWIKVMCGQLRGKLHFVLGNHDILPIELYSQQVKRTGGSVNAMIMLPHQKLVLTHFPVHASFFEGNKTEWKNFHGHCHTQKIEDARYIGCSYDQLQIRGNNLLQAL
jgi:calcineurin-like phosphoesterase family protein